MEKADTAEARRGERSREGGRETVGESQGGGAQERAETNSSPAGSAWLLSEMGEIGGGAEEGGASYHACAVARQQGGARARGRSRH